MTDAESVEFSAELFAWKGEGSWYFVRLPLTAAEDLRDLVTSPPRGFGSIRVSARLGGSTWATSVFPDKASASFVLPVKKPVRIAEGIEDGDRVSVALTPVDD